MEASLFSGRDFSHIYFMFSLYFYVMFTNRIAYDALAIPEGLLGTNEVSL